MTALPYGSLLKALEQSQGAGVIPVYYIIANDSANIRRRDNWLINGYSKIGVMSSTPLKYVKIGAHMRTLRANARQKHYYFLHVGCLPNPIIPPGTSLGTEGWVRI